MIINRHNDDITVNRKVEDLQFLLEEQDIISGDKLEEVSARESTELQQLKTQLEEEKEKRKSKF